MGSNSILIASQLSAIIPSAPGNEITVNSSSGKGVLHTPTLTQSPSAHATYSSVFHSEITGTILLRVIDGGLTIELVSLSTDLQPLRLIFPALLLLRPSLFVFNHELHLLSVTRDGSIFRHIFPLAPGATPWRCPVGKHWTREHQIVNGRADLDNALVQIQGAQCVIIGFRDGSLLRVETDTLGNEGREDEWREYVFTQNSFLSSLSSFIHTPDPKQNEFISITSHTQPTDNGNILTLSRDRTLRLWSERSGCVAAYTLPSVLSIKPSTSRMMTPAPRSMSPPPRAALLEGDNHSYIRLITRESETEEWTWAFAFTPTPSATNAGGFFHVLRVTSNQIIAHSTIECSANTAYFGLQDFVISGSTLHTLWNKRGQTTVEKLALTIEKHRAEGADGALWQIASYVAEPELIPSYFDHLLLSPGSLTDHLMAAITKPGTFSPLTLRAAIQQYQDHYLALPTPPPLQLRSTYASVNEEIAAVVGCTVVRSMDPLTGAVEHEKYWQALKRDWEGFVARCRDIERSARTPLALGIVRNDVVLVERERVGVVVAEDIPIQLYRCLDQNVPVNGHDALFDIIWKLRHQLSAATIVEVEGRVVTLIQLPVTDPLADHIINEAEQMQFHDHIEEGFSSWLQGRLEGFENLHGAVRNIINTLGQFDKEVKREEDEVALILPPTNTDWATGLAFAYASATIEARYGFALSLVSLLFFLAEELPFWEPTIIAESLAVFRGIAMLRQIARRPSANPTVAQAHAQRLSTDDIAIRMRDMTMSRHANFPFVPTYSLMHQLFTQSMVGTDPANAAHRFLDTTGLVRSDSHTNVTVLDITFCERLRLLGHHQVVQEMLSWLPHTPAVTYVRGRLCLDTGRADEAAQLFEMVGGSFGEDNYLRGDDFDGLTAVLPLARFPSSISEYYSETAQLFSKVAEVRWTVHFSELALENPSPALDIAELWDTVFKGYLDLAQYDDAYSTLITMEGEGDQKRDYISTLVYRMCEENAVEKLMSFNFVGLTKHVEDALLFKVRIIDPRVRPFYSRILYSWYVGKNDYRNAALTMYQRGRKLAAIQASRKDMLELAVMQREAYVVALNALSLLDAKSAWFVLSSVSSTTQDIVRKERKLCKYIPDEQFAQHARRTEYIDVTHIQRDLAFITTRLDIIREDPSLLDIGGAILTPEVMVERLTHTRRFNTALSVACTLGIDMTTIFTNLTHQCLNLRSRVSTTLEMQDASEWLLTDQISSWPGTPAERGWRYIRQILERHDGPKTEWKYSQTVLETYLASGRSSPPPWLVKTLEEHQPENLIRVCFRFERWESALEYAIALIRKTQTLLAKSQPENAMASWLPYSLIDQVLAAAREQTELNSRTRTLLTSLDTELSNHVKRMQKLSQFR